MSIAGKVALVTGASRGIGAAIAAAFGTAGARVVGTATTDEGAERIAQQFDRQGIEGAGMALDVRDGAAVNQLLEAVEQRFGAPLILVNNAGITRDNLLLRMKEDEWRDVIETNLGALYRLSKGCARAMTKARWGRIINISSVVARMGNAGQVNYAATKAGVEGFGRALARELGSRGITVNTIAPGFIDTDMTRALPEAGRAAMLERIPLGRFGAPEEIAAMAVFLAGDGGAYITGETIQINGGMYMH
ncbi:MAG: 3-oxoacyl-ACP reductase FabG [Pseudomonadales bacterium]|nr:3-oxoacyl-ACP reductase FabG [Pseudomonadales bacterium]